MYGPLVQTGGIIAFHDIVKTHWPGCQVDRFWNELAKNASLQPRATSAASLHTSGASVLSAVAEVRIVSSERRFVVADPVGLAK